MKKSGRFCNFKILMLAGMFSLVFFISDLYCDDLRLQIGESDDTIGRASEICQKEKLPNSKKITFETIVREMQNMIYRHGIPSFTVTRNQREKYGQSVLNTVCDKYGITKGSALYNYFANRLAYTRMLNGTRRPKISGLGIVKADLKAFEDQNSYYEGDAPVWGLIQLPPGINKKVQSSFNCSRDL